MKVLKILLAIILIGYVVICTILYLKQESLLFIPTQLDAKHQFNFEQPYEEINLETPDKVLLNAVLFKSEQPKGVVFFLHGNAGSIQDWGWGVEYYLEQQWDILYLDYRGYGKSQGTIKSEQQLIADAQLYYDYLKGRYGESQIAVSGISIGTGMAAAIASQNKPQQLILQCPYSSLLKLVKENVSFIPNFLVKYQFDTQQRLQQVTCPITIFHGKEDATIPVQHSIDLGAAYPNAKVTLLDNIGHNDIPTATVYQQKLRQILNGN